MSEWCADPRPIPGVLRPRSDTSDKSGQLTACEDNCSLGQLVPMQNWNGNVKQCRDAKALKVLFVKPESLACTDNILGEERLKIIFSARKICEVLNKIIKSLLNNFLLCYFWQEVNCDYRFVTFHNALNKFHFFPIEINGKE